VALRLGLRQEDYTVSFQSRLGRDPWIKPYTDHELESLAKSGKKRVLVFSPAFVADCLETVHEIGVEYQEEFEKWGGTKVQLVPSLNSEPAWVKTVANMARTAIQ
jgi:ferrochelatase